MALTRHAAELGFAGALVLPPFYYKGVPDDGLVAYVETIVQATAAKPIPIYLYHFPQQSGLPWHVALVRRLLDRFGERIVGLKDSSGDMAYAREAAAISTSFAVFPSTEAVLLEARAGAFAGCISATANLNADLCRAPWAAATPARSTPPSPSASCSTASRWCPASRRCWRISTAIRRWRGSSRRWRRSPPPTGPSAVAGYDQVRAKRVA